MTLAQRLLALHAALEAAALPHAFGGAIALAFWTAEPRGTRDLDVNVFVDAERAPVVHAEAARNRRTVPFEGAAIPVLAPVELAIFKLMFDRTKDWADVEAMLAAGTLDTAAVRAAVVAMVGETDARVGRLDGLTR